MSSLICVICRKDRNNKWINDFQFNQLSIYNFFIHFKLPSTPAYQAPQKSI
jgi:hypothetical protein